MAERSTGKRKYVRRSDDERIAELEQRIHELKAKQVAREKKNDPVMREIPKIQRRLRKFAQLASDERRADISNMAMAFSAGLERILREELAKEKRTAATPEILDLPEE